MELFTGSTHSNWGSLAWFWKQIRRRQDESQAESKLCQVADESVVVKKSRPEKAGNRLEEKTGMTLSVVAGDVFLAKSWIRMRREEVSMKIFWNQGEG